MPVSCNLSSMSEPIDVERVLADELDKLSVGAGGASRQLPKQAFETVVEVRADAVIAAAAFSGAIGRWACTLLGSRPDGPDPVVAGVVGGGF